MLGTDACILLSSDDGSRFLSSAWDRHVKLWDTETGKCIHSFTNGKVPYQSKFRPGDNNSFLSACSSKEIAQYDIREGKQEFTYDYHLAAVNTITFVEGGNRFVSTSDDKKMLVWEWNTNVPIKWISEPTMHSMPAVTIHPSGAQHALAHLVPAARCCISCCSVVGCVQASTLGAKAWTTMWWCTAWRTSSGLPRRSSLGTTWLVMHARSASLQTESALLRSCSCVGGRGWVLGNHALHALFCWPRHCSDVSLVARFTMSGDGNGRLFFWDWRTTKVYRKLRAHNKGPCFGSIWHPIEPSCVATCGWDGLIKLWD